MSEVVLKVQRSPFGFCTEHFEVSIPLGHFAISNVNGDETAAKMKVQYHLKRLWNNFMRTLAASTQIGAYTPRGDKLDV